MMSPRSGSDLKLRRATTDDAAEILYVYVESGNAGFDERMPRIEATPSRLAHWTHDLGPDTPTQWWLAQRAGQVVGFAGIGPCREPIEPGLGELDTIAVLPSAWRTGVGSRLMSIALDALRAEGYRTAVLWTLSQYPRGESFYLANGWRRNGTTRQAGGQERYDFDLRVLRGV